MAQLAWTMEDIPSQTGKIALITGATRGLGFETAKALARAGATVIIAGRNDENGRIALEKILKSCPTANVEFEKVDLASLRSISECVVHVKSKHERLDILVNNAAILTTSRENTEDGFEMQFGTNHLAHFALTAHLLPLLQKSSAARVVCVASSSYKRTTLNFDDLQSDKAAGLSMNMQSKLANVLFALELQRKSEEVGWGISSNPVNPGFCRTEGMASVPGVFGWFLNKVMMPFLSQSAEEGALTILFAATSPDAQPGAYYAPNGAFELRGPVAQIPLAPNGKDMIVAFKLWDISVDMTGASWT